MIRTEQISFKIGTFHLKELSLEVAKGQYFVLLGPPGSGKTIFLECLCGLKRVASGRVYIDGRDVTRLEPRVRRIGYVPQDYALFPHLSVEGNIAFGMRARYWRRKNVRYKTAQAAEVLGIGHLLGRGVFGLSGGERQQVALARALAPEPKVLLLDEPLSALDETTRQEICLHLRRIQRQLGLTVVHVSHNLEEAFSVADQAGVLRNGTLQQTGAMAHLLRRPRNEFVARFMRCNNLFAANAACPGPQPQTTIVQCGQAQLLLAGQYQGRIKLVVLPENVHLAAACPQSHNQPNSLPVTVSSSQDCGSYVRVELQGPLPLVAHLPFAAFSELQAVAKAQVVAILEPQNIYVLPE
jgi:ABC-type sugar transport system ATPase subunit